jgi:hypothetical protein
MNEEVQKRFLEARKRYNSAKQAWYGLAGQIPLVGRAMTSPEYAQHGAGGWTQMAAIGHPSSARPRVNAGDAGAQFDPSKWPTGQQIAEAWIEINQAFRDVELAYKALSPEDRSYLDARSLDPNER